MALGPLELVVLSFPAARLRDGITAALSRLLIAGDVRIVDAVVIRTDLAGGACAVELLDLSGPTAFATPVSGLITESDVDEIASVVDAGTDAIALLVEHRWTTDLAGTAAAAEGTLVASSRMPATHAVVAA